MLWMYSTYCTIQETPPEVGIKHLPLEPVVRASLAQFSFWNVEDNQKSQKKASVTSVLRCSRMQVSKWRERCSWTHHRNIEHRRFKTQPWIRKQDRLKDIDKVEMCNTEQAHTLEEQTKDRAMDGGKDQEWALVAMATRGQTSHRQYNLSSGLNFEMYLTDLTRTNKSIQNECENIYIWSLHSGPDRI